MPIKKVSVISIESVKIKSAKLTKHWENVNIKDNFFYVHVLFFLLGLMHFLPYTFFVTANAYWMEKFRNVSGDDMQDASKRTTLQSHFASATTMSNTITYSIFIVISALFGHKVKARSRTLIALGAMTISFVVATVFVVINTDSWQTLFFIITVATLSLINAANAVLQISVLVLIAKFPPHYMNVYLFGQGCAAVFNSILQVITLAIGTSTTASALIYFGFGASIMGLTFVMFFFSAKNKLYMYFLEHSKEDIARDMLSLSEFKDVLMIIWPSILTYMFYDLSKLFQTPVMSLVVSENYGSGTDWGDIYFVPVITFLFGDICTLFGRIACSMTKALNPNLVLILSFVRIITLAPLILLCNAQPRNHLPVLLDHDWEYAIVQGTLCFTNGYLFNMIFLSIIKLMEPEKVEDGYLALVTGMCVLGAIISPIGAFSVDIL